MRRPKRGTGAQTLLLAAVAASPCPVAGQGSTAASGSIVRDATLAPARAADFPLEGNFDSGIAGFTLRVNKWLIAYRHMAILALPGDDFEIEVVDPGDGAHRIRIADGAAQTTAAASWTWTAPDEVGAHAVRIESVNGTGFVHLNVLVMQPISAVKDGALNGYPIGSYRAKPFRGLARYLPPAGFAEIWTADEDLLASPHFTVGQFLCKEPGEPRYLALSTFLLLTLEAALYEANDAGYAAHSFFIMSGFRTPAYNRAIGNRTSYSRHLWGDGADIYIDNDGDGIIDDLNGDGRSDIADARLLARIVDGVEEDAHVGVIPGGLSVYGATSSHSPFVHIDTRGYRARW